MNFGAFLGAAAQALEGATKQPQAHGHGNSSQGGAAGGMGMLGELLPMLQGGESFKPPARGGDDAEFKEKAAKILPAEIRMFSGCRDEQTSADVSNTASFGLPADCGPGGAGGACTNAMMLSLTKNAHPTWIALLDDMRDILKEKGFEQIPQLSSSREVLLKSEFKLKQDSGPTKALFIGINYVGQQGELRGCHNDVIQMKQFVTKSGYDEEKMKVLLDDGEQEKPTHDNIIEAIRWLTHSAQPGESLFMHYSGHGGRLPDDNGDEADGYDETIVPVDYQSAGQIRDDTIFKELCAPLPKGCTLTVVMDCCHSGTVLDLPFSFACSADSSQQVHNGSMPHMPINANFNWEKAIKVAMTMFTAYQRGGMQSALTAGMRAFKQ